jgi:hypothetical protein
LVDNDNIIEKKTIRKQIKDRGNWPIYISSTRAQDGIEEMGWGLQVEQKEAQRAKL